MCVCVLDLQFSTDDEEFEEVAGEFENATAAVLGQGEGLARSAQPISYPPGKQHTTTLATLKTHKSLKKNADQHVVNNCYVLCDIDTPFRRSWRGRQSAGGRGNGAVGWRRRFLCPATRYICFTYTNTHNLTQRYFWFPAIAPPTVLVA